MEQITISKKHIGNEFMTDFYVQLNGSYAEFFIHDNEKRVDLRISRYEYENLNSFKTIMDEVMRLAKINNMRSIVFYDSNPIIREWADAYGFTFYECDFDKNTYSAVFEFERSYV